MDFISWEENAVLTTLFKIKMYKFYILRISFGKTETGFA